MENSFIFQQMQFVMYFSLLCGILLQWSIRSHAWNKKGLDTFLCRFHWFYCITLIAGAYMIIGLPGKGFLELLETTIYYGCVIAFGQFILLMGLSIAEIAFKKSKSS